MNAVLALLLCTFRVASASEEHDHGSGAFEWAGIFEVPESLYMWTAQKVDGGYVDATMKMAVLPANAATDAALEALEPEGKHSLEMNCTEVHANGVITPMEDACYDLHFDQNLWQTLYRIDTSSVAHVAFFTQHVPTEFENTAHYLKDSVGEDIEPMAEHPHSAEEEESHAEWGASIGAAILVNIVTLIGVILILPCFKKLAEAQAAVFEGVLCSFAAGALIACALFLLLFEATHLVGEGWTEETDIIWRWGTMVLLGFFLPNVFDTTAALVAEARSKKTENQEGEQPEGGSAREKARIVSSVLIGDFMHNLCDGFFLGAAFKGCGVSFGWGVALGTVLHEVPQELADYAILTGSTVQLKPWKALVFNFLSGLSVVIGVLIINAAEVGNPETGLLLAFGGGVYLYVAAAECMPKVHKLNLPAKTHLLCTFFFVLGAVLIGLILLDHEHCVPEGGDGHGHGHGHGH
mmetsp:Transcript_82543/g.191795  ORF Transcript_82543/g.191795 Transcript_82543/m.191795 type:complete len:465 (+) Transcript_82543:57-1451(+)